MYKQSRHTGLSCRCDHANVWKSSKNKSKRSWGTQTRSNMPSSFCVHAFRLYSSWNGVMAVLFFFGWRIESELLSVINTTRENLSCYQHCWFFTVGFVFRRARQFHWLEIFALVVSFVFLLILRMSAPSRRRPFSVALTRHWKTFFCIFRRFFNAKRLCVRLSGFAVGLLACIM